MHDNPFDFDRPCAPPLEFVEVEATSEHPLPTSQREHVALYTPHDGGAIPKEFRFRPDGSPLVEPRLLERLYVEQRDWGANVVAARLASALALPGYARCRPARVLLDFNRFPGSTPANTTEGLESLAIGRLYAEALNHQQKTVLLENYYDPISDALENLLGDKLISIAVHTYDETHASETRRADVSIVSLALSYQRDAQMTLGVFDPLYPDDLAESMCSRILRDRISLDLERADFRVSHNHPYSMPDGSIEVRAQVWHFFRHLRRKFERAHPETVQAPSYARVWTLLLDTNLRLAEAETFRGFLHRFRKVPADQLAGMNAALEAYRHVRDFMRDNDVAREFRRSPNRPSSLGLEIRKDLVCTFDPSNGGPQKPTAEQKACAHRIAQAIAGAIATYIEHDREQP